MDDEWTVGPSVVAKRVFNPIRNIVDNMKIVPHPDKKMIALSIGDPTVFGNLQTDEVVTEAVVEAVRSTKSNGYPPSHGYHHSRAAIAQKFTTDASPLTADDVVIASSCSGALDLAITALLDEGDNLLVPKPGFSLYETLAVAKGIEPRKYNLIPEKQWEADIAHLESLIDGKTRGVVVTNPSNPCGSNYSAQHIEEIVKVCARHKLPIIADEIYAEMVFAPGKFHALAPVAAAHGVPVLACGGLAKRYLVPGWRLGWILVHNHRHAFTPDFLAGLNRCTQLILGANSVIQGALPTILHRTPPEFYANVLTLLRTNAETIFERLSRVPGLLPVMPQGAMYLMVGIHLDSFPDFKDDQDFTQALITEQSVFCLPAACFSYPNFFRIVITIPTEKIEEACDRIEAFCDVHRKK